MKNFQPEVAEKEKGDFKDGKAPDLLSSFSKWLNPHKKLRVIGSAIAQTP